MKKGDKVLLVSGSGDSFEGVPDEVASVRKSRTSRYVRLLKNGREIRRRPHRSPNHDKNETQESLGVVDEVVLIPAALLEKLENSPLMAGAKVRMNARALAVFCDLTEAADETGI